MKKIVKAIKLIGNPAKMVVRLNSHGFARLFPDKFFLKCEYKHTFGKKLNLKDPQTYNEKIQWLKLYDRRLEYTAMVDKYEAKKYVADIIGEEYIIPTLGVWDRFEDIDFESLPDQFVLKCTHDSGGLAICRNKDDFDIDGAREKINKALKCQYFYAHREWPYKNVKPRIIAEQYMEDNSGSSGLTDYKFFCFNNEAKMLYVSQGLEDHSTARISFYDLNGNEMPFRRSDYRPIGDNMTLPNDFEDMLKTANKLARSINSAFVRVDLYSTNNGIKFSEITFSPCAGMIPFDPPEWNETLGTWIKLPEKVK